MIKIAIVEDEAMYAKQLEEFFQNNHLVHYTDKVRFLLCLPIFCRFYQMCIRDRLNTNRHDGLLGLRLKTG